MLHSFAQLPRHHRPLYTFFWARRSHLTQYVLTYTAFDADLVQDSRLMKPRVRDLANRSTFSSIAYNSSGEKDSKEEVRLAGGAEDQTS